MKNPAPVCFLDLDGVCCDIVSAALRVHGRDDLLGRWPAGEYRLAKVLGMSEPEFWAPIDALGLSFWAELDRYPWADELVAMLERFAPVVIASAPNASHYSAAGKVLWLQRHFGGRFATPDRYALTAQKHLLAGPRRVLIDDHSANCHAFRNAGGFAVTVPQPWNELYRFTARDAAAVVANVHDSAEFGLFLESLNGAR